ncbi:mucin-5AC [Hyalella azteca]|uniref:Mucin-5AC n=1 Tax=Hyalella azteca TaxID=294128 RepID=A0A8B7N2N8_HYAAZ|nr:mucin-5AC [Hyalella azteca]
MAANSDPDGQTTAYLVPPAISEDIDSDNDYQRYSLTIAGSAGATKSALSRKRSCKRPAPPPPSTTSTSTLPSLSSTTSTSTLFSTSSTTSLPRTLSPSLLPTMNTSAQSIPVHQLPGSEGSVDAVIGTQASELHAPPEVPVRSQASVQATKKLITAPGAGGQPSVVLAQEMLHSEESSDYEYMENVPSMYPYGHYPGYPQGTPYPSSPYGTVFYPPPGWGGYKGLLHSSSEGSVIASRRRAITTGGPLVPVLEEPYHNNGGGYPSLSTSPPAAAPSGSSQRRHVAISGPLVPVRDNSYYGAPGSPPTSPSGANHRRRPTARSLVPVQENPYYRALGSPPTSPSSRGYSGRRLERSDSLITVAHLNEDLYVISPFLRLTLTNMTCVVVVAALALPNFATLFYTVFRLVFGTLFPAYYSYKAVKTKNVKEYVKWMMYWIVFAFFTCFETITDLFLAFWFPFYYELKIVLVLWLLSPATRGSSVLYRRFVHPWLTQREDEIDECIARAKEQGYSTVLQLGTKGVNYATSVIMQTAIKGGGGLVNQLKRSYSVGELGAPEDHLDAGDLNSNTKAPSLMGEYDPHPRHTGAGSTRPLQGSLGDTIADPTEGIEGSAPRARVGPVPLFYEEQQEMDVETPVTRGESTRGRRVARGEDEKIDDEPLMARGDGTGGRGLARGRGVTTRSMASQEPSHTKLFF